MEILTKKEKVNSAERVADILRSILRAESVVDREKEHFWVIGVSPRMTIKYLELVTLGLQSQTLVHPREIYRLAIIKGVSSIILAHNHPSGDATPSNEDKAMTERLIKAGTILGIPVLDHIIVADENSPDEKSFFSFNSQGFIERFPIT